MSTTIGAAIEYSRMELALRHWAVQTARAEVLKEVWLKTIPNVLLRYRARECLAYWKARVKSEKSSMSRVIVAWRYELPRIITAERSSKSLAVRHSNGKLLKRAMAGFVMMIGMERELNKIKMRLAMGKLRRRIARIRTQRVGLNAMLAARRLEELKRVFEEWRRYRVEIGRKLYRYVACRGGRCREEMIDLYYLHVGLCRMVLRGWRGSTKESARINAVARADREMAKLLEVRCGAWLSG